MGIYRQTSFGPIHYIDHGGSGPTAVFVHGLGGSTCTWDALAPGLTDHWHALALDLPGFGLTPPGQDFKLSTHLRALDAFVETWPSPIALIGNSTGGLLAEMLASGRPELVDRMILISPVTPPGLRDSRRDWPTVSRLAIEAIPFVGDWFLRRIIRRHTNSELVQLGLESLTPQPGRVPVAVVEALMDLYRARRHLPWATLATNKTAGSIAATLARRRDFVKMVRRIMAPTLVIQGLSDHIVSPTSVEWLCSLRADWSLVQLAGSGHIPQMDAPQQTADVIRAWLADAGHEVPASAPSAPFTEGDHN